MRFYHRLHLCQKTKRRVFISSMAAALAGVITAFGIMQKTPASGANTYFLGNDSNYIYFTNSIPHASPGRVIINPLGYFVSIYSGTEAQMKSNTYTKYYGTVFTSCGSTTGRAGYSKVNPKTGREFNTGQTSVYLDYREGSDLYKQVKRELGQEAASFMRQLADPNNKQANGWITVNTLICAAQLQGSGYKYAEGWGNKNDATGVPIAYTQVRLKTANPITSHVLHDLSILNYNYTYDEAYKANTQMSVLQVYGREIYHRSGNTIISAINNNPNNIIHQKYNLANLNANSFVAVFSSGTKKSINHDCYDLISKFFKTSNPVSPTTPDKNSGGAISTDVVGFNNFGQSTTLYSGQPGYFQYHFTNNSYEIKYKTKTKVPLYDIEDGKRVPVIEGVDKAGNPIQKKGYLTYWEAPDFQKYNTTFTAVGEHSQYTGSDLNNDTYPKPNSTISRLLDREGLIGRDQYPLKGNYGGKNTVTPPVTSNKFRANYNAGTTSVPARATMWMADKDNRPAYANTVKNMQVIPSDVEAYDITLEDAESGEETDTPYVGETLIPVYHYRNNTEVPVLAIGHGDTHDDYLDGHSDSFSSFVMQAGEEIEKHGHAFKVIKTGNESTDYFTISCSTWLDDFDGDASWESDDTNNTFEKSFYTLNPLTGYFIEPNSDYRENTDVISSFMIENQTGYNITNDREIKPVLTVSYNRNGQKESVQLSHYTLVCPRLNENMIWFKWHVPAGLDGSNVHFSLSLDPDRSFIDLPKWGDLPVTGMWTTMKNPVCQSPDTAYAEKAPSWYDSAVSKLDTRVSAFTKYVWPTKSWTIYKQNGNGSFYKQTFDVTIPESFVSYIKPTHSPTAVFINKKWYEKSGYGFTLTTAVNKVNTGAGVDPYDHTDIQNVYVLFPEFMYDTKFGSTSSSYFNGDRFGFKHPGNDWNDTVNNGTFGTVDCLVRNKNMFNLPCNSAMLNYLHYTPLWYPNGPYNVKNYAYDVWTPAGMLSAYTDSNEIRIRGNMYSDYYIAGN